MRAYCKSADEFWVATAFVTTGAVADLVDVALNGGAKVKFLTGTFGNNTRLATFSALHKRCLTGGLEARVWSCGAHRNFHSKLYLWRTGSQAVAWVGSANFTDGGLQNDGELILEIRSTWSSPMLADLRRAFTREWNRADVLTKRFLAQYVEAPRIAPDARARSGGRRQGASRKRPRPQQGPFFVTSVDGHYKEGGPVYERVERLLGGTARYWLRHKIAALKGLKPGQRGLFVDNVDGDVATVEITDRQRDGGFYVFAYEPVFSRRGWRPWNAQVRKALAAAGLGTSGRRPRTRLVSSAVGEALTRALYPRRRLDK